MSNPREEVVCQYCGDTFEVPNNLAKIAKWCPACRVEAKREAVREYDREHREMETKRRASIESIGGEYHITKDPDDSWCYDSSFTYHELVKLLADGFLVAGTEFRLEPSRVSTHRVVKHGDRYTLSPVVASLKGITVTSRPREIPYFLRVKEKRKACLSTNV